MAVSSDPGKGRGPGRLARWEARQQERFDEEARRTAGSRYDNWGVRLGPRLDQPGSEFRYERGEGYATGAVDVERVSTPIWVSVATQRLHARANGGLALFALGVFVRLPLFLSRRMRRIHDSRWRLAVLHGRAGFPSILRPVLVEFFDTEEEADARRLEILTHWSEIDWGARPVIGVRERRQLGGLT